MVAEVVEEVARRDEGGSIYELQRRGEAYDILVDGHLAVRSAAPRIDKEIVELALAPWETRDDIRVLLAGLGMGFTLRALLDRPQVQKVNVVEHSHAVIDWCGGELAPLNGGALRDKRVNVVARELGDFLRGPRPGNWTVILLDTDVWPVALGRPENVEFYQEDFFIVLETALRPGGVLAFVSAVRDDGLQARLAVRYQSVARVGIPVELDGEMKLYYLYRGRRSSVGGGAG